ncbi:MAG: hypothetical protein R2764_15040 [Bacteroidales bacterium]
MTYAVWAAGVGTNYIPSAQGFMVEVNTPGVWNINVINGYRTHVGADKFYKTDINDLLVIQASANGYIDKTYVRFLDEATSRIDRLYDAHKLLSSSQGVPQIYTIIGDEILAINALPETGSVIGICI